MRIHRPWLLAVYLLAGLTACARGSADSATSEQAPAEIYAEEAVEGGYAVYEPEMPSSTSARMEINAAPGDDDGLARAPSAAPEEPMWAPEPEPEPEYERAYDRIEEDERAYAIEEAEEEEMDREEARYAMRERELARAEAPRRDARNRRRTAGRDEVADYRYQQMLGDMPDDDASGAHDPSPSVQGGLFGSAGPADQGGLGGLGAVGGEGLGLGGSGRGGGGSRDGFAVGSRQPAGNQPLENFVVSNLQGFADEDSSTVVFQEASGYWGNTYLPGDPTLRALHGHLRTIARPDVTESGLALSNLSTMYAQPFDAPTDSAMAVYVHSDRAYIDGETRMIVQVGLQGAIRNHGQRPAMNIALVLDLRNDTAEHRASVEALFETLRLAHDTGDVFSVVVAGPRGGLVIPPGEMGYGATAVAVDQLFEGAEAPDLTWTSLDAAVAQAIDLVSAEDLASPLGSSLVLIATPGLTGSDAAIENQIHQASVDGVMTSTLALGMASGADLLDSFALAGQGNRREALSAEDVEGAVHRELAAAGRVIARAVRLRIRLAPGVRLVEVLGSHNLNERQAQRVRDLEQSVDRRLSASLGIQEDRGEDEDGIQIVIPAYYAGDAHVFLLDVVADGPGPIADVTVRYKDLVHLDNAVARDALSLARNLRHQGPLETNVVKNVLGYHLAEAMRQSAEWLEGGDPYQAANALERVNTMLRQAFYSNSALGGDPELAADLHMLDEYLTTMRSAASYSRQQELAGSLRYAAYLKHQRPLDTQENHHD